MAYPDIPNPNTSDRITPNYRNYVLQNGIKPHRGNHQRHGRNVAFSQWFVYGDFRQYPYTYGSDNGQWNGNRYRKTKLYRKQKGEIGGKGYSRRVSDMEKTRRIIAQFKR
jgi:hypothetical protein